MKKTILTLSVLGAAVCSSMAQGTVSFISSGALRPVQFTLTGQAAGDTKVPVGAPAQVSTFGSMNIEVFSAAAGTSISLLPSGLPDLSQWTGSTPIISTINSVPGQVNGTTITLGSGSSPVQLEVVGWTGTATSYANALLNTSGELVGFSGSTLSLGALGWSNATGTSLSPAALVVGATGYDGLVLSPVGTVPEPTTIALGGLAAAALLAFRRRK